MDVHVVDERGRTLAAHRFDSDATGVPERIGEAFAIVARHLGRASVPMSGPAVAVFERRGPRFSVSAGFLVTEPFPTDDEVQSVALPAGEVLRAVHVGAYADLGRTYEELRAAAGTRGRVLDEHLMWEEYLSGPDVPPEQTRTAVSWPLLPA